MITNFTIKNIFGYKDLNNFSLISGGVRRQSKRLYNAKDFSVLKFSAIYGANASGKSKIVEALALMKFLTINGFLSRKEDYYFKLDKQSQKENSYFELEMLINERTYLYGFAYSFSKNRFVSEWLCESKNTRANNVSLIFERNVDEKLFEISRTYNEPKSRNVLKIYKDEFSNSNEKTFLSFLAKKDKMIDGFKISIVKEVFDLLNKSINIISPTSAFTPGSYFLKDEKLTLLSDFLTKFDTGITKIKQVLCPENDVRREMNEDNFKKVVSALDSASKEKKNAKTALIIRGYDNIYTVKYENGTINFYKIHFFHENNETPFTLQDESGGTIRLIDLAEVILTKENNKIFVIDEIDRCFHPQLTTKFICDYLKLAENEKFMNQLIVTTHESRLLDFEILRRDEIWFVNKKDGISNLYSLEEFNERFDKKIDKAYLDGRYGGVPIFDSIYPCREEKCKD